MGRNLGNPPFATRESLPSISNIIEEACKVIGINLRKMGLRDKTVEFEPYEHIDGMIIKSLIDDTNPSLIISFILDMQYILITKQQQTL